jgi:hypothetical protein
VKRPKLTAVSRTLEFQNPNAVCKIVSGVGEDVFTIFVDAVLAALLLNGTRRGRRGYLMEFVTTDTGLQCELAIWGDL